MSWLTVAQPAITWHLLSTSCYARLANSKFLSLCQLLFSTWIVEGQGASFSDICLVQ